MHSRPLLVLSTVLALAACSETDSTAPAAPEQQQAPTPDTSARVPDAAPADSEPAGATAETTIPAALQGRWGLVPLDCTSTRGDAKGLLVIDAEKLRFYESVGTLAKAAVRGERSLRGEFAFTGEGMEWTRDMALEVDEAGRTLVRREFGAEAQPAPMTYRRCA